MFKTLTKWIGGLPWWLLLLGGPALIIAAALLTARTQTHKLVDTADTPQLKAAIREEIKRAEEQVALDIGRSTVLKIQSVTSNPELQAELEQALEEIEQARGDLASAKAEAESARQEAESAAQDAAKEGAAARKEAEVALKQAEAALARAKKKLDEQIGNARKKSKEAGSDQQSALKDPAAEVVISGKTGQPADTGKDTRDIKRGSSVDIGEEQGKKRIQISLGTDDVPTPPGMALPSLPPELKAEIGTQVKRDLHRVVIGSTTVLAMILLFIALIISKSVISVTRALRSRAARSEEAAQQASLSRQLMEAKLAAMQAQIEPHFLFNTLASVDHLIETDPPAASRMQKNLIAYLRAAIPQMRESTTTLGREAEMCRAYLNILQVRMESRLSFEIAIAEELKSLAFPPMMLPTLTENAIKHGLEPKPEGGEIRISAARAGDKLRVSVCDTGMGFAEAPGSGVGLANIRERLQALYGGAAALVIEPNTPQGTIATVEIPVRV